MFMPDIPWLAIILLCYIFRQTSMWQHFDTLMSDTFLFFIRLANRKSEGNAPISKSPHVAQYFFKVHIFVKNEFKPIIT